MFVYSTEVFLSRAVSLVGVAVVLAAPVPSGAVDLVPTLTSTPFGAIGGQSVTHTILVSATGTGTVAAVRVTFTTTAGLEGATASTSQGRCSMVDKFTVVCELGDVIYASADAAAPKVTIGATVTSASAPGALMQNLVKVTSQPSDADASNNSVSNAYLVPGKSQGATGRPDAASSGGTTRRPGYLAPVAAGVLVFGALAGAIVLRRRRR